jgi:hypothetical protein
MRILVAGDWHANGAHALATIDLAARSGIERIVQVGDFGFWPRFQAGRDYLAAVSHAARDRGVEVWFCDGNHEDHDSLPHAEADAPTKLAGGVIWVPRGVTVEWSDRKLLFMGGAVSVDRDFRTSGRTWFASEIPSDGQWRRAMRAGQVDVVIAHDTVPSMPVRGGVPQSSIPWSARQRAAEHRDRLEKLRDRTQPELWIHGHWHDRASARIAGTRFESLSHDRTGLAGSVLVCDLTDLSVEDPLEKST